MECKQDEVDAVTYLIYLTASSDTTLLMPYVRWHRPILFALACGRLCSPKQFPPWMWLFPMLFFVSSCCNWCVFVYIYSGGWWYWQLLFHSFYFQLNYIAVVLLAQCCRSKCSKIWWIWCCSFPQGGCHYYSHNWAKKGCSHKKAGLCTRCSTGWLLAMCCAGHDWN